MFETIRGLSTQLFSDFDESEEDDDLSIPSLSERLWASKRVVAAGNDGSSTSKDHYMPTSLLSIMRIVRCNQTLQDDKETETVSSETTSAKQRTAAYDSLSLQTEQGSGRSFGASPTKVLLYDKHPLVEILSPIATSDGETAAACNSLSPQTKRASGWSFEDTPKKLAVYELYEKDCFEVTETTKLDKPRVAVSCSLSPQMKRASEQSFSGSPKKLAVYDKDTLETKLSPETSLEKPKEAVSCSLSSQTKQASGPSFRGSPKKLAVYEKESLEMKLSFESSRSLESKSVGCRPEPRSAVVVSELLQVKEEEEEGEEEGEEEEEEEEGEGEEEEEELPLLERIRGSSSSSSSLSRRYTTSRCHGDDHNEQGTATNPIVLY